MLSNFELSLFFFSHPSLQASYWSNKKYQVYGDVYDASGTAVRHIFGAWHEAVFCGDSPEIAQCVWRAGTVHVHSCSLCMVLETVL